MCSLPFYVHLTLDQDQQGVAAGLLLVGTWVDQEDLLHRPLSVPKIQFTLFSILTGVHIVKFTSLIVLASDQIHSALYLLSIWAYFYLEYVTRA